MFGQIVVMRLFRDRGFLTQVCGNNFMVLKAAPPLVIEKQQMDDLVAAMRSLVELGKFSGNLLVGSPRTGAEARGWRLSCRILPCPILTFVQSFDDWVTICSQALGQYVNRFGVSRVATRSQRSAI